MQDTENALKWIVEILETAHVPFQILGGFAAHIYGSPRKIADIDIAIPEEKFDVILPKIKQYLTFGPGHYHDAEWDLQLMTISYKGQEIDLAGAYKKKFFDHTKKEWVAFPTVFSSSEYREIFDVKVPFIKKKELIAYKKMLARKVDIEDVKILENQE